MSTPFLSDYLKAVEATANVPANPVSDPGTSPEMIAFCYDAETQTLTFWDPVAEERLTVSLGAGSYSDADAQDAVGSILSDAGDIDFTYVANTSITAAVKASAITNAQLANAAAWSLKLRNAGTSGAVSDAALADLTAEASPAAGDFLVGFLASGEIRKFDIGNLPTGSSYTDEEAQDAVGGMVDASLNYVDGTPLLQRAALTGDVTAAAGSNVTTIAAASVDPAMLSFTPMGVKLGTATPTGTGTVSFTSIPATYKHLLIVMSGRSSAGSTPGVGCGVTFNGDTGANYDFHGTQNQNATNGTLAGAAQISIDAFIVPWSAATANNSGGGEIWVENYADTNLFKHVTFRGNTFGATAQGTTWITKSGAGLWRSATAINRVDLTLAAGNFVAGSQVDLYGLN